MGYEINNSLDVEQPSAGSRFLLEKGNNSEMERLTLTGFATIVNELITNSGGGGGGDTFLSRSVINEDGPFTYQLSAGEVAVAIGIVTEGTTQGQISTNPGDADIMPERTFTAGNWGGTLTLIFCDGTNPSLDKKNIYFELFNENYKVIVFKLKTN